MPKHNQRPKNKRHGRQQPYPKYSVAPQPFDPIRPNRFYETRLTQREVDQSLDEFIQDLEEASEEQRNDGDDSQPPGEVSSGEKPKTLQGPEQEPGTESQGEGTIDIPVIINIPPPSSPDAGTVGNPPQGSGSPTGSDTRDPNHWEPILIGCLGNIAPGKPPTPPGSPPTSIIIKAYYPPLPPRIIPNLCEYCNRPYEHCPDPGCPHCEHPACRTHTHNPPCTECGLRNCKIHKQKCPSGICSSLNRPNCVCGDHDAVEHQNDCYPCKYKLQKLRCERGQCVPPCWVCLKGIGWHNLPEESAYRFGFGRGE